MIFDLLWCRFHKSAKFWSKLSYKFLLVPKKNPFSTSGVWLYEESCLVHVRSQVKGFCKCSVYASPPALIMQICSKLMSLLFLQLKTVASKTAEINCFSKMVLTEYLPQLFVLHERKIIGICWHEKKIASSTSLWTHNTFFFYCNTIKTKRLLQMGMKTQVIATVKKLLFSI